MTSYVFVRSGYGNSFKPFLPAYWYVKNLDERICEDHTRNQLLLECPLTLRRCILSDGHSLFALRSAATYEGDWRPSWG